MSSLRVASPLASLKASAPRALLLALALAGCAHDKLATRGDDKELADLSARTEQFWRSMQWQDPAGAAPFLEEDGQRRRWLLEVERLNQEVRITDASLVDLQLQPAADDPPADRAREAIVLVRTEGYTMPAQIVRRETVQQTWYRSADGWFLDWSEGHPLTGTPW